jgi:hypothetical protein
MAQKDSMSEMTVPFRDRAEYEDFGLAGYLRFVEEPDSKGIRGALFCVNSRGEPIDFSFTRIDVGASFLWRLGDARRHAVTALCKALFAACPKEPALLLSLAEEVSPRVFTEDIEVGVPLCRVAEAGAIHSTDESSEILAETVHLFWVSEPPAPGSQARGLLEALHSRQLSTEPFERATTGLEEAFS